MAKSSNDLKEDYNNHLKYYKYKAEELASKKNARKHKRRHKLAFFIQNLLKNNKNSSNERLNNCLSCPDYTQPNKRSRCGNCTIRSEEVGKLKENLIPVIELEEHQKAQVRFIKGDYKVIRRLLDMGITTDATISLIKLAPLNGPVEVAVRGSKLALGRGIASNIFVEVKK